MKKILPLVAAAAALAACGNNDHEHRNHSHKHGEHHVVAPAAVVTPAPVVNGYVTPSGAVVRPDGTYTYGANGVVAVPGAVVEDHGYQHKHSDDALSDRRLGATRGTQGQPMSHKDSDNDGNYDYVPQYRTRPATYYYTY